MSLLSSPRLLLWLCVALLCNQVVLASTHLHQKFYHDRSPPPDMGRRGNKVVLPRPLDSVVSGNFSSTCQSFFTTLETDQAFQSCLPLSLLLQTSTSFFQAQRSFVLLTETLDTSCSANVTECSQIMNNYASQLLSTSACATDFANQNAQAIQTYNGLLAYPSLYYAGCLRDGDSGTYCLASSISNSSNPTASFPYYLPLGTRLPSGYLSVCNGCLQNTFSVFSNYAANATLPISVTYPPAAQMVDMFCGPTFVKQIAEQSSSTGAASIAASLPSSLTLAAALLISLAAVF